MTITSLVIRNISRRRGRFVFTLLGITIGIASFVTFLSLGGSLKREVQREATALGANLVVTAKGSCAYEQVSILTGEQLPPTISRQEFDTIRGLGGLTAVPVLSEKTAIRNRPVTVLGIDPEEMRRFKGWQLAKGSYFGADAPVGAVVGSSLSSQSQLSPGTTITIRGQQVTVVGVLAETGSKDDVSLFLPLPLAQELFKAGDRFSYVPVKVHDVQAVDATINRIKEVVSLGVVTDKQMLASVLSIVGTVTITLQLIAAVSVLAAAFGIINTMLTATYERKREIGILQAMGARRRTIFTLFLLESGCYGLLGGITGVITGLLVSTLAAPAIGQNAFTAFVKGTGGISLDLGLIGGSILFSALVAVLAGLYPAWRAARLSPVEAISYE
jgi:putative ABC transport system permease protein